MALSKSPFLSLSFFVNEDDTSGERHEEGLAQSRGSGWGI